MAIGVGGALLTLVPSLPSIVLGLALFATGVFIAQATASSYIGASPPSDRGLAVGLYSTFYYIGGSVGGALPALFWNAGGWPACVVFVDRRAAGDRRSIALAAAGRAAGTRTSQIAVLRSRSRGQAMPAAAGRAEQPRAARRLPSLRLRAAGA